GRVRAVRTGAPRQGRRHRGRPRPGRAGGTRRRSRLPGHRGARLHPLGSGSGTRAARRPRVSTVHVEAGSTPTPRNGGDAGAAVGEATPTAEAAASTTARVAATAEGPGGGVTPRVGVGLAVTG